MPVLVCVALIATLLGIAPTPALAATTRGDLDKVPVEFGAEVVEIEPFSTIGVSWTGSSETPPAIEVHTASGWMSLGNVGAEPDLGPDDGSTEAVAAEQVTGDERFSEPFWVGDANGYRVRARRGVRDATVHLIRTRTVMVPVLQQDQAGAAAAPHDGPAIHGRSEWGAAPPASSPTTAPAVKMAIVHHTAGSNDYTPEQVPSIIAGIQTYHQRSQGWNDIGYNFLVDKFGRIWEGRAGGIGAAVVGAHASGVNTGSVGVSVLGNYTSSAASDAAIAAVGAVIGWKFALHGVDANATTTVTGNESNKFVPGQVVTLPTIVGHRDVGTTSCPGMIQGQLGLIRSFAAARAAVSNGTVDHWVRSRADTVRAAGWGVDVRSSDNVKVSAFRNGSKVASTVTSGARADVSALFPAATRTAGFALDIPLADGDNSICVYVEETTYGARRSLGCTTIAAANNPVGNVEAVTAVSGGYLVRGWAFDPNTTQPIPIHVYVDGVGHVATTGTPRPDLAPLVPAAPTNSGFDIVVPADSGRHTICAYAINVGAGSSNVGLGCRSVGYNPDPVGEFLIAARHQNSALLVGWALDPDTTDTIGVLFFNNGRMAHLAGAMYPWDQLAGRFPSHGTNRLFFSLMPINRGRNDICAYALNVGPGNPATFIGCHTVVR